MGWLHKWNTCIIRLPLKKFWGQKHAKFPPFLHNFRLWSWISTERDKISKIGKICDRERFLPRSAKQSGELWSTIYKVVHVSLDPPKSTFLGDYMSAPRACWPLNFLHTLDTSRGLLAHTTNRVGGPPQNFKSEHLKLGLKFHICADIT